jgi:hypothetical protein
VLTTTDPAQGAMSWTVLRVDSHGLEAISCPSSTLCVAVDSAGNVVHGTAPVGQGEDS